MVISKRLDILRDKVVDCHGSVHFLQTAHGYTDIWPTGDLVININEKSLTAELPLPKGPPSKYDCK